METSTGISCIMEKTELRTVALNAIVRPSCRLERPPLRETWWIISVLEGVVPYLPNRKVYARNPHLSSVEILL